MWAAGNENGFRSEGIVVSDCQFWEACAPRKSPHWQQSPGGFASVDIREGEFRPRAPLHLSFCVGPPPSPPASPSPPPENVVVENGEGVGVWGGACVCPDGRTYQVGDNHDWCKSLACHGGAAGVCNQIEGAWSYRSVTCAPPVELQLREKALAPPPLARLPELPSPQRPPPSLLPSPSWRATLLLTSPPPVERPWQPSATSSIHFAPPSPPLALPSVTVQVSPPSLPATTTPHGGSSANSGADTLTRSPQRTGSVLPSTSDRVFLGAIAFGGLAVGMLTLLVPVWIYEKKCAGPGKAQGKHSDGRRGQRERRGKRGSTKYSSLERVQPGVALSGAEAEPEEALPPDN